MASSVRTGSRGNARRARSSTRPVISSVTQDAAARSSRPSAANSSVRPIVPSLVPRAMARPHSTAVRVDDTTRSARPKRVRRSEPWASPRIQARTALDSAYTITNCRRALGREGARPSRIRCAPGTPVQSRVVGLANDEPAGLREPPQSPVGVGFGECSHARLAQLGHDLATIGHENDLSATHLTDVLAQAGFELSYSDGFHSRMKSHVTTSAKRLRGFAEVGAASEGSSAGGRPVTCQVATLGIWPLATSRKRRLPARGRASAIQPGRPTRSPSARAPSRCR